MTSVYGVTFVGARDQIANRLKERGWDNEREVFAVSRYLARITIEALQGMFKNATTIMDWLANCAQVRAVFACTLTECGD